PPTPFKLMVVLLLGPPPVAVLLAEVLLNITAMFNHGNVYIAPRIDRLLRRVVVTPDMHRVHHSVLAGEHNCNFGFNFPWWDRLFGSYRDQPGVGHADMRIGIEGYHGREQQQLHRLLLHPLRVD
ncbi:MAG TPA: sterol desaturase family protein, partial [Alcanivorax sp.]|nr:sterol desaturase family protein [Alcanivorax sp.]